MRRFYLKKISSVSEAGSIDRNYERCVVCGARTDVPVDTPVGERKCYVPGGGQLCGKCCIELYGTDDLRSLQSAELDQMFPEK